MSKWLRKQWNAFASSYDAPLAAVRSSPSVILLAVGSTVIAFLVLGYVPALAILWCHPAPWLPAAVLITGGLCSYVAWRHKATGPVGTACMLLDTLLYSLGFSLAATLAQGPLAIGFALILALFLIAFPAPVYALTWPIAIAMCLPPVVVAALFTRDPLLVFLLLAACVLALVLSRRTAQQHGLRQQNQQLRSAISEADTIAKQTMEIALASSLVDIGHLLHELRNLRNAQTTNLQFLKQVCSNSPHSAQVQQTLDETIELQKREVLLIDRTVERIRKMAHPSHDSFVLEDVVNHFVKNTTSDLTLTIVVNDPSLTLRGDKQHLIAILDNLLRNAHQAGATNAEVTIKRLDSDEETEGVCLVVQDNGPGLDEKLLDELFQPFRTGNHMDGTGLGLYLAQRYVELLGGTIEASNAEEGGAVFRMSFPNKVLGPEAES